ncbi:MAG: RHS repeat-associated core domain-containing protein [Rhodocyclaceae bacterium]|nr:RHS repeat-associated core domain-containing protein [Rhodocyclaceae bacterium]
MDEAIARYTTAAHAAGAQVRVFLTDALGSVVALARGDRGVATRYGYSPYGEGVAHGEGSDNSTQYTGRDSDDSAGLYYDRARYFDAVGKMFFSEDPLGVLAGLNKYTYVNDNPISYTDPEGLRGGPGIPGWGPGPTSKPQRVPPDSDFGPGGGNCSHYPAGSAIRSICENSGSTPKINCVRKCLKDLYPDTGGSCPPQKDDPWFGKDHPFCWRYCGLIDVPDMPPWMFGPFDGR